MNDISTTWPYVYHDGTTMLRDVSVFEGIRVYRHDSGAVVPWLLQQHLDRLRNSCTLMGLDDGVCASVPEILEQLLSTNGVAEDGYARVTVSAGNIEDAARSVLTVTINPSSRMKWLALGEGMRLAVSACQSEVAFSSGASHSRLALVAAQRSGYDSCVLSTADGVVSSAPDAAVFLVEGGRLVTPRLADGALPGVTRAWVLAAAQALGIDGGEAAVTPERLAAADEVFLCGTGLEFAPVREVDGRTLPGWPVCATTTRIVDSYFDQARGLAPPVAVGWRPMVSV
jgi:branched-chain amino acid aminotransferase